MSFKKNKYSILKKAISSELADFVYKYFLNKREVAKFLFANRYISPFTEYFGVWNDQQVPNTYSHYSDIVMETLLREVKPVMQKHTKLKLSETYSYARIYKKGDILARHKDRYSCEISTTLNLGGDSWPIYLDPTGKNGQAGVKVNLEPGDMLIYSGCDLEHWREEFKGKNCCQLFLHYNKANSKIAKQNYLDKRPLLGVPAWFRNTKLIKK
nr:putative ferrochelatase [uncultured Mediterranean phage uvMED]BAR38361.1 putative ferrochelatase [uncultured Mediterranean phage uvMED]